MAASAASPSSGAAFLIYSTEEKRFEENMKMVRRGLEVLNFRVWTCPFRLADEAAPQSLPSRYFDWVQRRGEDGYLVLAYFGHAGSGLQAGM
jgi:hypothetical protein